MASRTAVIAIFASVGFAIGFFAFLASPALGQALAEILPKIVLDPNIVFAIICGAAGAGISTVTVTAWAKKA